MLAIANFFIWFVFILNMNWKLVSYAIEFDFGNKIEWKTIVINRGPQFNIGLVNAFN